MSSIGIAEKKYESGHHHLSVLAPSGGERFREMEKHVFDVVNVTDVPTASAEALQFLVEIDESDIKRLIFDDNLSIFTDNEQPIGEYMVTVQRSGIPPHEMIILQARSSGAIEHTPCGTSVSTAINNKMETIEQKVFEYVKLPYATVDKTVIIKRQMQTYAISRYYTMLEKEAQVAKPINYAKGPSNVMYSIRDSEIPGFITEGATLILQRLLILKRFPPNFRVVSVDSNGMLCTVQYKQLENCHETVGNTNVEVFGLEKTVSSAQQEPIVWKFFYMKDGHLISRHQVDSPVVMKVTTVPFNMMDQDRMLETHSESDVSIEIKLNWENDPEISAFYQYRKEELIGQHTSYIKHSPTVCELLVDFLQHLLLCKPEDVIEFASSYFFRTKSCDSQTYKDSFLSSNARHCKGNMDIKQLTKKMPATEITRNK